MIHSNLLFLFYVKAVIFFIEVLTNFLPDHEANVFNPPVNNNGHFDKIVNTLLSGFRKWDSIYFSTIAEHGYIYLNMCAFFPLFPILIRLCGAVVHFIIFQSFCLSSASILLGGVILNCTLSVISHELLLQLGFNIFGKNSPIPQISAFLFCISPAAIFFCSLYSESLFFCLTIGMLLLLHNKLWFSASVLCFCSILCRSNGVVNVAFIAFYLLLNIITNYKLKWIVFQFAYVIILCILPLFAIFLFQFYVHQLYCIDNGNVLNVSSVMKDYGILNSYVVIGNQPVPGFCHWKIPFSYSYIQNTFWEVGLFRYYQLKKLPNFFLSFPVVFLSVHSMITYCHSNMHAFLSLQLLSEWKQPRADMLHIVMLPYFVHVTALTLFGLLNMHVEVITRLLFSAGPLLYWYMAYLLVEDNRGLRKVKNTSSTWSVCLWCFHNFSCMPHRSKFIIAYCSFYIIIGSIAHCNFLPWT